MKNLGQRLSRVNQIKVSEEMNKYPQTAVELKTGLDKHYWSDLTMAEAMIIHRAVAPASERFGIAELSNLFNS